MAFRANATALSAPADVFEPIAIELVPRDCVPDPGTPAVPPQPIAIDDVPFAPALTPIATPELPVTSAPLPTATPAVPVLVAWLPTAMLPVSVACAA
ncbi:hypothetical protein BLA24064_02319 [Burkholderia latens]|uniref:Uncharacterized protein n=1 Tax=Burkholderia latens TaxID=488446 RepID=A0A6P2K6S4_9BURK|nr:hypothetical protein BLA24064_02319 [Burkholderia latens]